MTRPIRAQSRSFIAHSGSRTVGAPHCGAAKPARGLSNQGAVDTAYQQFLSQDQPEPSVLQIVLQAAIFTLWLQSWQNPPQVDSDFSLPNYSQFPSKIFQKGGQW
jgi:hypothetical protein